MTEYLQKIKEHVDCLASAGVLMFESDLVSCALAGLDPEYLPLTTVIERDAELTWTNMHASLINFKAKLQQIQDVHHKLAHITVAPSANLSSRDAIRDSSRVACKPGYRIVRLAAGRWSSSDDTTGRKRPSCVTSAIERIQMLALPELDSPAVFCGRNN
ncbi:hypothetical protein Sjap_012319 [Stephania japonica]|uniref:Uncharacterized protein n=1 Tax=Stephania japonica TaxID=461633 RepID=A0AAP0IXQ6_9MAGN